MGILSPVLSRAIGQVLRPPLHPTHASISGSVWTPAKWFLANEQGLWLDPSDFTRYMADKGPELVTNGGLSSATGWTLGATWAISGGVATVNNPGAFSSLVSDALVVIGKWYEMTFTVVSISAGSLAVRMGTGGFGVMVTAAGTYKSIVQCLNSASAYLQASAGTVATVDNISVRELTAINTATLFQDSTGTTPVTAVEQPVGLMLDKRLGLVRGVEGVANPTLANGAAGWTVSAAGTTITYPNGVARIISPGGTLYGGYMQTTNISLVAGRFVELVVDIGAANANTTSVVVEMTNGGATAIGSTGYVFPTTAGIGIKKIIVPMGAVAGNGKVVVSINVRKNTGAADPGDWVEIRSISIRELPGNHASQSTTAAKPKLSARKNLLLATTTLATQSYTMLAAQATLSFKGTGTVTLSGASTAGPLVGTGASNRVSLTFTPTAGSVTFTVSGSVTEAQLEYGASATTYQRVNTATDYDTVGFPHYLKFDGVDDGLVTGNINFTGTDKMTVVAGATHLSAAAGTIVELGLGSEAQGFWVQSCPNSIAGYSSTVSGATGTTGYRAALPLGTKAVVATQLNIAATAHVDKATLRLNGTSPALTAVSSGATVAAGFRNGPLHIGRRGGVNTPHSGQINQLIVRGAYTADLAPAESFTATKIEITL